MANSTGFGKPVHKPRKASATRQQAAQQYDSMQTKGLPEFNIFIRIQGQNNWFPAGSLVVERSNQINAAIYQNEMELVKGGARLFPILNKHRDRLEYGYRLKSFPDEPIELAVRPVLAGGSPVQAIASAFKQTVTKVANLLPKQG